MTWPSALMEGQLGLDVVIGAVTAAAVRARRAGARIPLLLVLVGGGAAAAVIPLVLFPAAQPVFLASNQVRLLWILVFSIWLVLPVRATPAPAAASPDATTR